MGATGPNMIGAGADVPGLVAGYAWKTPWGVLDGPGGNVAAYVRATALEGDDPVIANKRVPTLAAALSYVRNPGDIIYVLPGHSENVVDATMFANLKVGTKVIGLGRGANQPVFRFTAAASSWAINKADCLISGLYLRCEGANGVTAPLVVTAADFGFAGNRLQVASGAALKATTVMDMQAGSDRFDVSGNVWYGTATHNVTDGLKVSGAVSDWAIRDNEMVFSATTTTGCIQVTAAALNGKILRNYIYNTMTGSTCCIGFADVASDGQCSDNRMSVTVGTATAPNVSGIVLAGVSTLWRFNENYCTPTKNTSGAITPVADT